MTQIERLCDVLKGHEVFIQTHDYPDPDAISSAYGLQNLLSHYNIKSTIVYEGLINKIAGIRMVELFGIEIFNVNEIESMDENAYIVLVDSQKYNRNCTDLPGIEIACIDHHPIVNSIDEYKFVDIRRVGACASIVAEYYHEAKIEPSVNVATALLYGIKMDTNDFGRGVEELDVEMHYRLFPYSDQYQLGKMRMNSLELSDLKAYGAAIENISIYKNVGFAVLPFECPDGLIGIISDFILAIDIIEFALVISKRNNGFKFSVRSELDDKDAGKIINNVLTKMGGSGGGHSFMAGGFLPILEGNDISDIRKKVEELVLNELYNGEVINQEEFIRNGNKN